MAKTKSATTDNTLRALDEGMKVDADIYNAVARSARLLGIQLIDSSFDVSPMFFEKKSDKLPKIDIKDLHESFDSDSRVASCMYELEVSERRDRRKAFSLRDRFVVFYKIDCECDEAHAVAFARRTGLMAVYPYFRAHLAQTASLANAEIPILPTIASMPVKKEKRHAED